MKSLLIISMNYSQNELNEPISIDILLNCIPVDTCLKDVRVLYLEMNPTDYKQYKSYDIILISTKISSFDLLKEIVHFFNDKIIIIGGIQSILAPHQLAKVFPNVIINTGEAETNLSSLITYSTNCSSILGLKKELIVQRLPNICFLSDDGSIYESPRKVFDLRNCPPIKHNSLESVMKSNGLVRMETSRGCPWNKCSFCVMPWKFCGEKWRPFSKEKISKEIELFHQRDVKKVFFTDEDFVGHIEHITSLCQTINSFSSIPTIEFGGSTSVYTLLGLGDKLDFCLQAMRQSGICHIFLGIESGSDSQLLRFCKGVTVHQNELIIQKLYSHGFKLDIGFIMFDADTTMEEIHENLLFIKRNGLSTSLSRFAKKLRLTPHTELFEIYKKRGLIKANLNINDMFYDYEFTNPIIGDIWEYLEKINKSVLLESYKLQAIIRSATSKDDIKAVNQQLCALRRFELVFLEQCVEKHKQKHRLSKEDIIEIYSLITSPIERGKEI